MSLTSLPQLRFTAGVHPHDAKSCDHKTMTVLGKLAASPGCVSIGECGSLVANCFFLCFLSRANQEMGDKKYGKKVGEFFSGKL